MLPGVEKFKKTFLLAVLKEGSGVFPKETGVEVVATEDEGKAAGFALNCSVGAVVAEGAIFGVNENPVVVEEKPLNPEGWELEALGFELGGADKFPAPNVNPPVEAMVSQTLLEFCYSPVYYEQ